MKKNKIDVTKLIHPTSGSSGWHELEFEESHLELLREGYVVDANVYGRVITYIFWLPVIIRRSVDDGKEVYQGTVDYKLLPRVVRDVLKNTLDWMKEKL